MKVLFKNTTKYDKENCNNFVNFHSNKYGKRELIKFIIISIILIYIFIFNIIYNNWYFFVVGAIVIALIYLINRKNNADQKKSKKKTKQYTFYFYDNYIKIRYRRQFDRMLYFQIKKIFETEENFFLYTDDKHSLILDKDGFEVGSVEEFSKFIKKKCPFKYNNENK